MTVGRSLKGHAMHFLYMLQIVGGGIMVFGYFPQVRQIIRTKSVKDLNIMTFIFLCLGIAMMEAYAIGLVVHDHTGGAFLITNTAALAVNIMVVIMIAIYRKPTDKNADVPLEKQPAAD
jgi:MtN3 and saliva related transmembrane protein